MATFADYAALARLLAEQRRAGEQGAAVEAEHRRNLHAAADSLQHRLTAQGQRLDHLGRAIGVTAPAAGPPAPPPAEPSPPAAGPPATGHPGTHHEPGKGRAGGAAAAPGRPGVGAYSPGLETALAVPAVPGPRAGEADPAAELELARRYADEADRYGQQAELLAQQPPLLPTWSPVARALAVYLGCAAVGVVLMLVLVLASGVGVVGLGTLYTWMCAGLPAVSLIAGWLVLGRWGRPAMVAGTAARYPVLGILVCFLALPLAYCGYLLLFRTLF
ncbi:hypothetical protein GKC29_13500 [Micromonospora sp. WMMC415]|uniref:hypothetical protein n=1 Tax=Micromonospora sp. WMMC415 TaxID=2675222 RepID=UPI0012B49A6B|nr:hypothetical protein [Micromonospora sp. WMMC415]QGN47768.1 hypothetical protein GKC29_13500 [Micromonospora sp. WMMC415]